MQHSVLLVNGKSSRASFDKMIMQDFIISRYGFEILKEYTDEIVFYNDKLNVYIWSVTHWGTGWAYELTNVKLEVMD